MTTRAPAVLKTRGLKVQKGIKSTRGLRIQEYKFSKYRNTKIQKYGKGPTNTKLDNIIMQRKHD